MAISERDANKEIDKIANIYAKIETDILLNVVKEFQFDAEDGGTEEWRDRMNNKASSLMRSNKAIIEKQLSDIKATTKSVYESIGHTSLDNDESAYKDAYESGVRSISRPSRSISETKAINKILKTETNEALKTMNLVNTTAIQTSNKEFLKIVNGTYLQVSEGITGYNTAIRRACNQLASKGITGLTYKTETGLMQFSIESAIRRMVLTSSMQMARSMQDVRAKQWGSDLWEISSHAGARPLCEPYQGKIFSQSGKHKKYKPISLTSIGLPAGLFGINCGHQKYVFIEGYSQQTYKPYDAEESKRKYLESQQQRYLEREVRNQKKRVLTADARNDDVQFVRSSKALKQKEANLRAFMASTGRTQQKRVMVAGFNKSISQRAVHAAKVEK